MALRTDPQNTEVVVTPPTEIDMATGDLLARRIDRACAVGASRVIVDFGGVTFCDSTAVAVLVHALETLEAQGCALIIRNPCQPLQRVAAALGKAERLGIAIAPGSAQDHP